MNLVVDAVTKESKQFGNTEIWGIKATDGNWYDFHGGFKPSKGQSLNCKVWPVKGKNGKDYMHADLIPEHPQQAQQAQPAQQPKPAAQPYSNGNPPQQGATGIAFGMPPPSNGKIKWDEWTEIADAASQLAHRLEPDRLPLNGDAGLSTATARIAFVNTTLIAFSNGKLELPTEAGPVSTAGAYDDPDDIPF